MNRNNVKEVLQKMEAGMQAAEKLKLLKEILDPKQITDNPFELITYERDATWNRGSPDAVVFPQNEEDILRIIQWAKRTNTPLIARGAGTGLSGGAVAEQGGVVISFSRMNQILELDEVGQSVVFQPGVVNQRLDEFVKTKGLYYPPDPASGRASTLGGNIAENAGGPHCFKYGVTTNSITGMKVILADGRQMHFGGRATDYPEFDFTGLITGSEGTLAVITNASARLLRYPTGVKTLLAVFDTVAQAGKAVSEVIAHGLIPATMEMMDQKVIRIVEDFAHAGLPIDAGAMLIIETDGYPESVSLQMDEVVEILTEQKAKDLRIAQSTAERERLWYARKSAFGAFARLAPAYYLVDSTVPRSKLAPTLETVTQICGTLNLEVGFVFHAGDGNLHPIIPVSDPDDQELTERVHAALTQIIKVCLTQNGSITGEHGVGIEKRPYMSLMFNGDELQAMHDLKEIFDPQGLLNPGKILPHDHPMPASLPVSTDLPISPYSPRTEVEAAEALHACRLAGKSIRVRGGGTKSNLLPAADLIFSTADLNGIQACELDDLFVTVGAGTRIVDLQHELKQHQMWVPIFSPWSQATAGGTIATNYNAALRMRYGALRDLTLTATVVLPDSRCLHAGKPVVKNVAGYDLTKLFVGSYGTLGLITSITFKLIPIPRSRLSLYIPCETIDQGIKVSSKLRKCCLVASSLLLCGGFVIPDLTSPYAIAYTAEGYKEDVQAEIEQVLSLLNSEGISTGNPSNQQAGYELWGEWIRQEAEGITLRLGVRTKDIAQILSSQKTLLEGTSFVADIASGLLYVRTKEAQAFQSLATDISGYSIVLDGPKGTKPDWGYNPESLDLMQALKSRWDPDHLLNPGAFMV